MANITNNIGRDVRKQLENIDEVHKLSVTSDARSKEAKESADLSTHKSDVTAKQLTEALREGDQPAEVQAARVNGVTGEVAETLPARLDKDYAETTAQLAQTDLNLFAADRFRSTESMINRKRKRRPMITIEDDDGHRGVFTKLRPLALEYGIVISSAIITSRQHGFPHDNRPWVDRYIRYDEMLQMQSEGTAEFVSHTHHHDVNFRLENMTEAERIYDLETSRDVMRMYGFNHRCVVYPFGSYTSAVVDTARGIYDYGVGTGTRGNAHIEPPFDNFDMRRTSGEKGTQVVKEKIDEIVKKDGWLIITTHIDQGNWYSESYMREIIEYALNKGVEFVTTEKGMQHHGNIAQFDETTISSEGVIFGDQISKVVYDFSTSISNTTPLSYFKPRKETRSLIRGSQSNGFPRNLSGMLITYRYSDIEELWSYQEFTSTREKISYIRHWVVEDQAWSPWINDHAVNFLGVNAVKITDTPNSRILNGRETYTYINSVGNELFPEATSGILTTKAFTTDGFAQQTYELYQSNKIYKRYWRNNNTWSTWELVRDQLVVRANELNQVIADKKASEFDIGITTDYINIPHDSRGFPNEAAGMLITYRFATELTGRFAYQEFKETGNFKKHIRVLQFDGNWSEWKEYSMVGGA